MSDIKNEIDMNMVCENIMEPSAECLALINLALVDVEVIEKSIEYLGIVNKDKGSQILLAKNFKNLRDKLTLAQNSAKGVFKSSIRDLLTESFAINKLNNMNKGDA